MYKIRFIAFIALHRNTFHSVPLNIVVCEEFKWTENALFRFTNYPYVHNLRLIIEHANVYRASIDLNSCNTSFRGWKAHTLLIIVHEGLYLHQQEQ
jgi:hypothetical protein